MLPPATRLYRYMPFEQFLRIVLTKKISAVLPQKWPDKYELYWHKYLSTKEGSDILIKKVGQVISPAEFVEPTAEKLKNLIKASYQCIYAICFSESGDEELMWCAKNRDDKTIMISTTAASLNQLGENNAIFGARLERVQYDLEERSNIDELLNKMCFEPGTLIINEPSDLLLHKRKCFSYEKEVRMLYTPDDLKSLADENGNIREAVDLDIPDIKEFIKGVMVCPSAEDRHVQLVKEVCDHFGINFQNKSDLYSFKI